MTVAELLAIAPSELAALSDEDLTIKLSALIPPSRAAYVGPKTNTVRVGNKLVSKREYAKKEQLLQSILANYVNPKP